jgi:hypothetical protein
MAEKCKLISLTCVSSPTYNISFLGLLRLLGHSFLNNQPNKITGFLIFKKKQFAQILEGEEYAVEKFWFKIQQDNRHKDIQFLSKEYIDKRSFSKWSILFPESQK